MSELERYFTRVDVVCQTAATFVAFIREGAQEEVLAKLNAKARPRLKLGGALIKFDYRGHSLTYVAPDRLLIKLQEGGTLSDAKNLLSELLS